MSYIVIHGKNKEIINADSKEKAGKIFCQKNNLLFMIQNGKMNVRVVVNNVINRMAFNI